MYTENLSLALPKVYIWDNNVLSNRNTLHIWLRGILSLNLAYSFAFFKGSLIWFIPILIYTISFELRKINETKLCLWRKPIYDLLVLISISLRNVSIADFNSEYNSLTLSSNPFEWSSSVYTFISSVTFFYGVHNITCKRLVIK